MWCIVVSWSDRSGIVAVIGPWRDRGEAERTAETLGAFAEGKLFEITEMAPVIVPATVS